MIVFYDPAGGFVTGGGWSLQAPDVGKATFGFVSKYQKGATVPTGSVEFQFQADGSNFKSMFYNWLVVSAHSKAQYKGSGTINESGDYMFMLTATDEDSGGKKLDGPRIKIVDKSSGLPVYDNFAGRADDFTSGPQPIAGVDARHP